MSTIIDQLPFADPEFVENAEPRCPCLLLLDTSTSMRGRPMTELNDGLQTFKSQLMSDENGDAACRGRHRDFWTSPGPYAFPNRRSFFHPPC